MPALSSILCILGCLFLAALTQYRWDWSEEADSELSLLQVQAGAHMVKRHDIVATSEKRAHAHAHVATPEYPWFQRGRDFTTSSSTSVIAPSSLEAGPSWVWNNTLDEQMRHSPLIDHDKNIYLATGFRIRKFDSTGTILWTWESPGDQAAMVSSPALYEGAIFAVTSGEGPTLYSIDMTSGTVIWSKPSPHKQNGDASSVFVHNRTVVVPMMSGHLPAGNDMMYAVSASDGSDLWNYVADDIFWNWAPATSGDGTLLASSSCGGVFRITFGGQLVYRTGADTPGVHGMCDMGGGALGPNGIFYTVHGRPGTVSAYMVSDGSLVWNKTFPCMEGVPTPLCDTGGTQYPAVGRLGNDGPLVVVAGLGTGNFPPGPQNALLEPLPPAMQKHNRVVVMNAESGDVLWVWNETPFDRMAALGDEENFSERVSRSRSHPELRQETMCLPDPQGIPLISGDGTIYTSSSYNGDLRAMKLQDTDGDGQIDNAEISLFQTHIAFLNSPSIASGMLVAAPCWGSMYVFKDAAP